MHLTLVPKFEPGNEAALAPASVESARYQPPVAVEPPQAKARKEPLRCGGLTYKPRKGLWEASNVALNADLLKAWSYQWWRMLDKIGPYVVFNDYRYSNSTSKHQSKVRSWLWQNSIDYVALECPRGLQDLDSAILRYNNLILDLRAQIAKPRTRPAKNQHRAELIAAYKSKLAFIKKLQKLQRKGKTGAA